MKIRPLLAALTGILTLLSTPAYPFGFNIDLGPFELELDERVPRERHQVIFDNPICSAISHRNLLEMTVEWEDRVSDSETKITTKKVTIEPYLFGKSKDGRPILRGNIIAENVLKEVLIKNNEEKQPPQNEKEKEGFLSGFYRYFPQSSKEDPTREKSNGISTVNIRKVVDIRVIEQSHFNPPANFSELFKGDVAEVICVVKLAPQDK